MSHCSMHMHMLTNTHTYIIVGVKFTLSDTKNMCIYYFQLNTVKTFAYI